MVTSIVAHEGANNDNDYNNSIDPTITVTAEAQETWNPVLLLTLTFCDFWSRYVPSLGIIFKGWCHQSTSSIPSWAMDLNDSINQSVRNSPASAALSTPSLFFPLPMKNSKESCC